MLALLGGAAWWGSLPYAPFRDPDGTFRLFENVPAHPAWSRVAVALGLAYAAWRYARPAQAGFAAWCRQRGSALAGDALAALGVLATLGFYPRTRASRALLADGLAAFPNDWITWLGLAGLVAGCSLVLTAQAPRLLQAAATAWQRVLALPPRRFGLLVSLAAFLASLAVARGWFHGLPVATDGVNYRFQANIFAHGRLTLPPPPAPEQFAYVSTLVTPRWRSIVTPGWPTLLAPAMLAGVPWLVNPLCHGATVALLYALGRRWWDERVGRVAALLAVGSPFLLLLSGSHMAHTSSLCGLLLFAYAWQRMAEGNHWGWGLAAGLALGWIGASRPLDAAAFGLPWGVWTLWRLVRREQGLASVAALGCGVALPLLGLGWYNAVVNGSPTTFGYALYYGDELRVGFGARADLTFTPAPHTPGRGLMNTNNQLNALNKALLGWPVPVLALVAVALRARNRATGDRLCAAAAGAVVAAYFLWIHADFMYGPRYYHAATGACLLLAARGVVRIAAAMGPRLATAGLLTCVGFAALAFYPPYVYFYRPQGAVFQGVQRPLAAALAAARPTHAVVVVAAGSTLAYGSAVWRNGDGGASDVVFALDDGRGNRRLRAAYPDRAFYRYAPDEEPTRFLPAID